MRTTDQPRPCITMQPEGSSIDEPSPPNGVETRAPLPGELCTCGRPATTVYVTERFGAVGYCGIPGARPLSSQLDNVSTDDRRAS